MLRLSLLLFSLYAFPVFSQLGSGNADSLRNVLGTRHERDTVRVMLWVRLANAVFTSDPQAARGYADSAMQLSEQLQWEKGIAHAWNVRGGVSYVLSDYVGAIDSYLKVLNAGFTRQDAAMELRVFNNLGNIYSELKDYPKTLSYYGKSLVSATRLGYREDEAVALGNMGTIYQLMQRYDSARTLYLQALSLARTVNNDRLVSNILCTLGSLYKETGRYGESVSWSSESIGLAKKSGNSYVLAPALNNLAWAYLYLGRYGEAEKNLQEALEVGKELGGVQWQSESWEALYTLYERRHEADKAFNAYKTFILLHDSVMNDERKQSMLRKELDYEAAKKEAVLNANHEAELERQRIRRNAVLMVASVLLLALGTTFLLYKQRRDADSRRKEAEFRVQVTDSEMEVMRLRMNPHFIFNSLNSINDYLVKNDNRTASEYLIRFAKMMRITLENSEQKSVPLAEDLKGLSLYLQMESFRMKQKFNYVIDIAKEIDPEVTLVPPLLLQPYVENSIWHGIAPKQGPGLISIHVRKEGDMLVCIIEDDGVGRDKSTGQGNGKKSLGMRITGTRIDILNKLKQAHASVAVHDLEQGTRVDIKLPFELSV